MHHIRCAIQHGDGDTGTVEHATGEIDQVLRVDWNVANNTTFYSRLNFGYEAYKGGWGFVLNNANWPQFNTSYEIGSLSMVRAAAGPFPERFESQTRSRKS